RSGWWNTCSPRTPSPRSTSSAPSSGRRRSTSAGSRSSSRVPRGAHLETRLDRSTRIGQRNEVRRMRRYGIYDTSRGLTLALAAALAGLGLWGAAQIGTQTTGRFWLAMAIVAGAGLLNPLAQHMGTRAKRSPMGVLPGTFALAFLPVLVCVGWILLATQPGSGWQEGR